MHYELPVVAFIAATSLLLPLTWHWQAKNVAILSIIFWLFVENIIYGVDAIVWGNTAEVKIPIWCDITTKLIIGGQFALPAACLCVCIHLERVASVRAAHTTLKDKKRRNIFEFVMCFGLPVIFMALHYVVQGHRFDIADGYGCRPTTYFSVAGIFIVYLPSIVLSLACLALRHFLIRRITFAAHLASKSALTTSRYMRLILMAIMQMIWTLSVTSFSLSYTASVIPIRPWTNWADVHSDFLRVDQFVMGIFPQRVQTAYYVLWSTVPASTFIFVAFFAFGKEAVEQYKAAFSFCYRLVARKDKPTTDAWPSQRFVLSPFLPLHNIAEPRLTRSDSSASSTVIQSPTSKYSKNGMERTIDTTASYTHSHTRTSLESRSDADVTFAVYSPSSSPVALRFPDSPLYPPSPTPHSVYTVPSLSAFPQPPTTTTPTSPRGPPPQYYRYSSRL
uniref:Putative pheromone receptor n=1 Tax=Flammulina velutipes TaxID=38945 RepID=F1CZK6_FLAVE|nr:putative pheromone receptor [Flammulina velutipes]